MAVNEVIANGETLISLTGDTVTPDTLLEGVTAHDAAGEEIVGSLGQATPTKEGIAKLYGAAGNNTDGAMTQAAVTSEIQRLDEAIQNISPGGQETRTLIYEGVASASALAYFTQPITNFDYIIFYPQADVFKLIGIYHYRLYTNDILSWWNTTSKGTVGEIFINTGMFSGNSITQYGLYFRHESNKDAVRGYLKNVNVKVYGVKLGGSL